ncbi:MAG: pyruvate dehydrogenase (acetyl-transferring), homodimeric type, partial [Pirellulales bacterium]|nr:pyruvate dehydrogenase (acetyl-transferring), homodimeric type [Pirellulales bacterium]
FGLQRIGDLIWAAGDMRVRGFMLGGTAGRTTLAGEGLQHQDGNSHLLAMTVPNLKAYDPAYAYEMAVIVLEGLKRMYFLEEDIFYYITLMNENYAMPVLPLGSTEGICRGIYRLATRELGDKKPMVQLFGSGAILREVLRAQEILESQFGVGSDVYSVTSYKELLTDARDCQRRNRLRPNGKPRAAYVAQALEGRRGPVVAASDYVSALPLSIAPWIGRRYTVLGTDGFGRSEARAELRRFFEVDAEHVALAALESLALEGQFPKDKLAKAIQTLGLDPDAPNPVTV